jgi:hypothetical protein
MPVEKVTEPQGNCSRANSPWTRSVKIRAPSASHLEDGQEFLPPPSGREIHPAGGPGQGGAESTEDLVPRAMAVAVVHLLEVVQVHEDHRCRLPATGRPERRRQEDPCMASVRELGEDVGEGHGLGRPDLPAENLGEDGHPHAHPHVRAHHPEEGPERGRLEPEEEEGSGDQGEGGHPSGQGQGRPPPPPVVGEEEGGNEDGEPEEDPRLLLHPLRGQERPHHRRREGQEGQHQGPGGTGPFSSSNPTNPSGWVMAGGAEGSAAATWWGASPGDPAAGHRGPASRATAGSSSTR